ncbi:MAG: L-fucokinase [Nibricoccus sp.]
MTQTILTTSQTFAEFSQSRGVHARVLGVKIRRFGDNSFVTADPQTQRLGSGGGSVNALFNAWSSSRRAGQSLEDWLGSERRLILHAGGESRRLPSYAAVGKAFIPMPREAGISPVLPEPLLADYQVPGMRQLLGSADANIRVMVASGDVWLDFDPSHIGEMGADITGVGMRVSPETAQHFGVYFVPKPAERTVSGRPRTISFFKQKPSPAEVRHLDASYDFYVDTGMWLFSTAALKFLFARCGWSTAKQRFTTPNGLPLALDLYTEIGCALGTETKPPAALKKLGFDRLTTAVVPLDNARFYHLGSSRQLLDSIEEMQRNKPSIERVFCISSPVEKFPSRKIRRLDRSLRCSRSSPPRWTQPRNRPS